MGTLMNMVGILLGGVTGWVLRRPLGEVGQNRSRQVLTLASLFVSVWLFARGWNASGGAGFKHAGIAFLALILGNIVGRFLKLQQGLQHLIRWSSARSTESGQIEFSAQAIVFCANPLGLLGAVIDGATGLWAPLAVKTLLDGWSAWGFAAAGSRTVFLSILPMTALQGTLTLLAGIAAAQWLSPAQIQSLTLTGSLLVLVTVPVLFGWKRVPLANYLPALVLAPLMTW